jgi:DNA-binding NtrC family response regulator
VSPRLPWWAVGIAPLASAYAATILLEAGAHFDLLASASLVVAVLAALVPRWLSRAELADDEDPALAAALATVLSLHAVASAAPARSLLLEVIAAVAPAASGALVVALAFEAPALPRPLARLRPLSIAFALLAAGAGLAGALVCLAPFEAFGDTVVLPGALLDLPVGVLFGGGLVAITLRAVSGRFGSSPADLARSSLAVLGATIALLALGAAGLATRIGGAPESASIRAGWLLGHAGLLVGHVAVFRGASRLPAARVGPWIRDAVATLVSLGIASGGLVACRDTLSRLDPVTLAFTTVMGLGALVTIDRLGRRAARWALAPDRGRLLDAVSEAQEASVGVRSFEELGARVLAPLARASRSSDARSLLWVVTPALEVTVDAAGQPQVRSAEHSPALLTRLAERPGEVVLRAPLEALAARRPELQALYQALARIDALAAVALVSSGELEGALVVARGGRRAAVTMEEIAALDALGARLSGLVATLSAERRAHERVGRALVDLHARDERIEALEESVAALRADAAALKAGPRRERFGQPLIAYGPSMRELVRRAEQLAPLDGPVLVRAEAGTALEPIGHLLHVGSARQDGPLVVADALSVPEGRAMQALFGTSEPDPQPGWLKLAQGGTLLLFDVPALPLVAQAALEEAIASRSYRPVSPLGAAAAQPLDARVVMTSRVELDELVHAGGFDAELARRLAPLTLVVPSLAARREDLRSLVLVAIDRGCRALGRPLVGIEEDALKALLEHPFSEGTRELEGLVERAVGRARGPRISLLDLELAPPTASSAGAIQSEDDAWFGSYTELETRILEKALERAQGNKSEAARALGLKRTTFLDKLRRAGLERPTTPPAADPDA